MKLRTGYAGAAGLLLTLGCGPQVEIGHGTAASGGRVGGGDAASGTSSGAGAGARATPGSAGTGGVGSDPTDDGGTGSAGGDPTGAGGTGVGGGPAADLRGIWNGSVALTAPGFFGPPLDTMRIVVAGDGRLTYFDFSKFLRSQQFGDTSADFPLDGTRDTNGPSGGCPSATCAFHVTVEESTFGGARHSFALQYHAVATGDVPTVDFVERVEATLAVDHLEVKYSMVGTWGAAPANVSASGHLALE